MKVELDETLPEDKYLDCCRNSKNWEYCCRAGEVYCNKCGRVLPDVIAMAVLE